LLVGAQRAGVSGQAPKVAIPAILAYPLLWRFPNAVKIVGLNRTTSLYPHGDRRFCTGVVMSSSRFLFVMFGVTTLLKFARPYLNHCPITCVYDVFFSAFVTRDGSCKFVLKLVTRPEISSRALGSRKAAISLVLSLWLASFRGARLQRGVVGDDTE
jgi:hypothetical protein